MTAQQDAPAAQAAERHTITLQLGETDAPLRIALPAGEVPAEAMMPALRTLTDAVVAHGIARSEARGRPISCKTGCAACCRHLVLLSDIEARALADVVERLPEPRRSSVRARFAAVQQRMAKAGLAEAGRHPTGLPPEDLKAAAVAYFQQRIDCPFLEDERCSIYTERPLACRKVIATSPPAFCDEPGGERVDYLRVPMLGAAVLLVTSDEEPPQPSAVTLPYLLDWAAANPAPGRRRGADIWMQRFVQRLSGQGG